MFIVLTQQQSAIASDLEEHTDGRKDDREELTTIDVSIDGEDEHGTRCERAQRGKMVEAYDLADITAAHNSQRPSNIIGAPGSRSITAESNEPSSKRHDGCVLLVFSDRNVICPSLRECECECNVIVARSKKRVGLFVVRGISSRSSGNYKDGRVLRFMFEGSLVYPECWQPTSQHMYEPCPAILSVFVQRWL
jgi:hypothetical protein